MLVPLHFVEKKKQQHKIKRKLIVYNNWFSLWTVIELLLKRIHSHVVGCVCDIAASTDFIELTLRYNVNYLNFRSNHISSSATLRSHSKLIQAYGCVRKLGNKNEFCSKHNQRKTKIIKQKENTKANQVRTT